LTSNWVIFGRLEVMLEEASNKLKRLLSHNYAHHLLHLMVDAEDFIAIMLKQQLDTYLVSISISVED